MEEKKPMKKWKKVVLIIFGVFVALFVLLMIIGSSGNDTTTNGTTSKVQTTEITTAASASKKDSKKTLSNQFLKNVKSVIQDQIGENESIKNIELKNNNLTIYVDLSQVDPAPLTLEMLAENRTCSITDAILELDEYDSLWNTITIDFGDIGSITNSKDDIKTNEYGMRYFDIENFKLT